VKIICVGGGPAGLYFAILMKRLHQDWDVRVHERNPAGRTHGWGVVYWDDLLAELQASDPESAAQIRDGSVRWPDQSLQIEGRRTTHTGRGGYSIGRHRLLEILAQRATEVGVDLHYERSVGSLAELPESDLIVAADGSGSGLRKSAAQTFGTSITTGRNKYIWLGTTKVLDAFTFALARTPAGWIWFHGYAHDSDTSTCVVECAPETWKGLGFDRSETEAAVRHLEDIFADALDGHRLLAGESSWVNFRTVTNETWHHGKLVLVGDAAHTTHFTIGSGTKLAFQDAIALASSLARVGDLEAALTSYGSQRREALRQPQSEAAFSAAWFENMERYMGLEDEQFFLLLRERRSPLLAKIPPLLYYRMHTAVERMPPLRALRRWIGPPARAAYSRWRS
jgi:2-polyprenyl-6-methoxyphenol hydroxylase-like FAD-dependent oxidoreductase